MGAFISGADVTSLCSELKKNSLMSRVYMRNFRSKEV